MNLKELKEIFRLIEKTDFTEVEIVRDEWRVRVERKGGADGNVSFASSPVPFVQAPMQQVYSPEQEVKTPNESPKKQVEKGTLITSPFVGTFYRSPSPDSASYVEVNQNVSSGDVLCIVEAMKLMNEIEAEVSGKIIKVFPENGQPVEFGEKLFLLEPDG